MHRSRTKVRHATFTARRHPAVAAAPSAREDGARRRCRRVFGPACGRRRPGDSPGESFSAPPPRSSRARPCRSGPATFSVSSASACRWLRGTIAPAHASPPPPAGASGRRKRGRPCAVRARHRAATSDRASAGGAAKVGGTTAGTSICMSHRSNSGGDLRLVSRGAQRVPGRQASAGRQIGRQPQGSSQATSCTAARLARRWWLAAATVWRQPVSAAGAAPPGVGRENSGSSSRKTGTPRLGKATPPPAGPRIPPPTSGGSEGRSGAGREMAAGARSLPSLQAPAIRMDQSEDREHLL